MAPSLSALRVVRAPLSPRGTCTGAASGRQHNLDAPMPVTMKVSPRNSGTPQPKSPSQMILATVKDIQGRPRSPDSRALITRSPQRDGIGAMRDFIARRTAEQIKQGNLEHSAKLASCKPVVDSVMDTEIAAVARGELAKASAARRAEEETKRKAAAREYYSRLRTVRSNTDNLMDTEAAAIARSQMAAMSRARRAAEAEEIRRENAAMKERIKNVVSLTDVDISDEVAGEAREKKAAESMARRQAQIEKLKVENEAIRQRLANAKAVTDDDVLDDVMEGGKVIGAARIAMSADSKARKAQAEQQLSSENKELTRRIANTTSKTDDGDGNQF